MKKILVSLSLFLLLVAGCSNTMNTPTKTVEEFLGRYQSMDSEILAQLDQVVSEDSNMSDEQKGEYRSLMEKQYQNLSYKIKNEEIDGNKATVDVEIEVYDYATSISNSKKYYNEHPDEFMASDENTEATIAPEDAIDNEDVTRNGTEEKEDESLADEISESLEETTKYIDYKIKELKNVTNKVKYDITFHLTKENDKWRLDDISDIDRQKIHGLYEE